MDILENKTEWLAEYQNNWLKSFQESGQIDWGLYNLPNNKTIPAGKGVDLSQSKLMVVTSGGFYVKGTQEPFDEDNPLGAYDIRELPSDATAADLAISHTHYNHTAVNQDLDVLIPLSHLNERVAAGEIGELTPSIISFMGYQPDATRVADETTPAVVAAAQAQQADAVLLIPA